MELTEAIPKQKKGKAPSPDGIPAEFYKQFEDVLFDKLKDLITEILDSVHLPNIWRFQPPY